MVSYKTQSHTGTRKLKTEKSKQSHARKVHQESDSDTTMTSSNASSMNYLFNNKMEKPNQMMGNPMMNQGYPMMNQGYPMMNQGYPMMNQGYPMMNQEDSVMNPADSMMNPADSMMNPADPMMNPGQMMGNQMQTGNSMSRTHDPRIDALSIQTFAPVKNNHNGRGSAINNLALLNNNMNNGVYSDTEKPPGNHAGMNYAGMNHGRMNYGGMNHNGINYEAVAPLDPGTAVEPDAASETYQPTYPLDTPTPNVANLTKLKL